MSRLGASFRTAKSRRCALVVSVGCVCAGFGVELTPSRATAQQIIRARALPVHHDGGIFELDVTFDGKIAISQSPAERKVWDTATGRILGTFIDKDDSSDEAGRAMVWGYGRQGAAMPRAYTLTPIEGQTPQPKTGGRMRLVDVATRATLAELEAGEHPLGIIYDGAHGRLVTAIESSATGDQVRIHDLGNEPAQPHRPRMIDVRGPADQADANAAVLVVSADLKLLATARQSTVELWDLDTGAKRQGLLKVDAIKALAFSPDGSRVWVMGEDGPMLALRAADLSVVSQTTVEETFSRRSIAEREGGRVIEVQGRFSTAFIDTRTGKMLNHERASSVVPYVLKWLGSDGARGGGLILRASRNRAMPTIFAVYRHERGDFTQLFKRTRSGLSLSAMVASPNARCLLLAAKSGVTIVEPSTLQVWARVTGLSQEVEAAVFTADGGNIYAGDRMGRVLSIRAPGRCRGLPKSPVHAGAT